MSAFKDAVAADVESVFLNADEFADYHDIDGERVKCVIDTDITGAAMDRYEGVFLNTLLIYAAGDAFERRPVEGQRIRIDDLAALYLVRRVSDEMGMLVITCEAYDQ